MMGKNNPESLSTDKRTLIIRAAVKVFSRQGFHQARVEDIAQEAGVGKGTVYEYFESKRHLFEEMVREGLNFYSRQLGELEASDAAAGEERPVKPGRLRESLRTLTLLHLRFFREYRDLAEVTMRDLTLVSAEMRAWMRDMRRRQILRIQEMVRQGQARGEVRADLDPELAAIMVAGALAGLGHLAVWSPKEPDLAEVAEKAATLVFDGIGRD